MQEHVIVKGLSAYPPIRPLATNIVAGLVVSVSSMLDDLISFATLEDHASGVQILLSE